MSGRKRFLMPNKRLVIDTYVLGYATKKEVRQRNPVLNDASVKKEDDAYELLTEVIEFSPVLVFSPDQWKEAKTHARIHIPSHYDIILELDEKDKLQKIKKTKFKRPLPKKVVKELGKKRRRGYQSQRRGHEKVRNDIHLFNAAYNTDKTLITLDENILEDEDRKKLILKETGVSVFSVSEALEKHRATKEKSQQ